MNITLKINCTQEQLQNQLAYSCSFTENTKPADSIPGREGQRASERGLEVLTGVKCEDISQNRASITSISSLTPTVKRNLKC